MTGTEKLNLILRAFKILDGDSLMWNVEGDADVSLFINCNDLFFWACADATPLTLDNIDILEQADRDMKIAANGGSYYQADILFCCRINGMRPQTPYYKYIKDEFKPLFDACGPVRSDA